MNQDEHSSGIRCESLQQECGKWFRDHSDKYLVVAVCFALLAYNLHILHHGGDSSRLAFVNGLINNLQGGFLTLATGRGVAI
jgi:hypothetical protein